MTDDLEVLEPAGSSVTYRNERIELRPLTIGQLPKLVRAARPVIDQLLALDKLPEEGDADLVGVVMDLIEHHAERVFEAASICTGKPADWLEGGDIDEFIQLATRVFEVNRDFFAQRLAPRLAALQAKAKASPGDGKTASSS